MRRIERVLVAHYEELTAGLASDLTSSSYVRAVEIAQAIDVVRGYEEVKLANLVRYRDRLVELDVHDATLDDLVDGGRIPRSPRIRP